MFAAWSHPLNVSSCVALETQMTLVPEVAEKSRMKERKVAENFLDF